MGKMVEAQNAETADSPRGQCQPTDARGRPAGARPPDRKLGRVSVHSGAGARARRLALSGLPCAAPLGRLTTWLSAPKAAPTSIWICWSRSAAGATTRPTRPTSEGASW